MSEEENKISKFSSGVNIIQRLDQLWKNCHKFKQTGQYQRWNEELDSVWLELARDLKKREYYDTNEKEKLINKSEFYRIDKKTGKKVLDEEKYNKVVNKKGYKTRFEAFERELKPLLPFSDLGGVGFEEPKSEQVEKRDKQYKTLMEKQLFLARLENEIGKGTSWEEEDEDF